MKILRTLKRLEDWIDEEDPAEPGFDPVQLGGTVLATLAAIGCLYWLLWTLLVYEGGLFLKLGALARVLFTSATLRDVGYEGTPYAMGAFEGWIGTLGALLIAAALAWALRRLFADAARRGR